MSARLNGRQFFPWKKLGYILQAEWPSGCTDLYAVSARAKGCARHYLRLIVYEGRVAVVTLMTAPVKPKRKWREVKVPRGAVDWETVPAAWFGVTARKLLEGIHDEERGAA